MPLPFFLAPLNITTPNQSTNQSPRETNWLDLEGNRHQAYFRRQEKKEKALYGVGRGQKYNASRQRSDVIERVRLRREERLKRDRERRTTGQKAAEDDVCSIS